MGLKKAQEGPKQDQHERASRGSARGSAVLRQKKLETRTGTLGPVTWETPWTMPPQVGRSSGQDLQLTPEGKCLNRNRSLKPCASCASCADSCVGTGDPALQLRPLRRAPQRRHLDGAGRSAAGWLGSRAVWARGVQGEVLVLGESRLFRQRAYDSKSLTSIWGSKKGGTPVFFSGTAHEPSRALTGPWEWSS